MIEQQVAFVRRQNGEAEPASERGGYADAAYLAGVAARSAPARVDPAMIVRDGKMGA